LERQGKIERKTRETDIRIDLTLDGEGHSKVDTSIAFMDHMFELMAAHGYMDINVSAKGDIEVDYHHTVEDLGICLGKAVNDALGEKKGIKRYGQAMIPMDDALANVVIDISNRPYLSYRVSLEEYVTGNFNVRLLEEFFRAFVNHAGITMHIELYYGNDPHHSAEAIFKAFSRSFDKASQREERSKDVPSTKGIL
jgi:imidazoleglycerol-phosphate dehydratase